MRHVIIGAGPAGVVAAETLRRVDPSSDIFMLGDEPEPPYSRMALPYLLAGNVGESGTHLRHGDAHFRLEFEDDRIVGALALGLTQHVGVVRGLIQTRVRLGAWMEKLRADPALVMNAYLEGGRI